MLRRAPCIPLNFVDASVPAVVASVLVATLLLLPGLDRVCYGQQYRHGHQYGQDTRPHGLGTHGKARVEQRRSSSASGSVSTSQGGLSAEAPFLLEFATGFFSSLSLFFLSVSLHPLQAPISGVVAGEREATPRKLQMKRIPEGR